MKSFTLTMCTIVAALASFTNARAETADSPAPDAEFVVITEVPEVNLNDPAFSRLVDFELLGTSIANGDVEGVIDVALQLANAEKILLRSHKSLKATNILATAVNIAKKSGDKESLARISKAAKLLGVEKLAQESAAALALGSASRTIDPPPSLAVNIAPQAYASLRRLLNDLEVSENAGDQRSLIGLLLEIETLDVSADMKAWLKKRTDTALTHVHGVDQGHADALSMLAGDSRQFGSFSYKPPSDRWGAVRAAGRGVVGVQLEQGAKAIGGYLRANSPKETQSRVGGPSGPVPSQRSRMQRNGYRTHNSVKMNENGQVRIGNQTVQARRARNPQTGRSAWVYKTKSGGTIVRRDGDRQTYVRPANR